MYNVLSCCGDLVRSQACDEGIWAEEANVERFECGLFLEKPVTGRESLLWPLASQGGTSPAPKPRISWQGERQLLLSPACGSCWWVQMCQVCCCWLLSLGAWPGGCLFPFQLQARAVDFIELQGGGCEKCKVFAPRLLYSFIAFNLCFAFLL